MRSEFKIADFKKVTNDFNFYILTHPDNIKLLQELFPPPPKPAYWSDWLSPNFLFDGLSGIDIRTDPNIPRFVTKREWKFPKVRFCEFQEKDIQWAEPVGFGHWVETETTEPLFYKISKGIIFDLSYGGLYDYRGVKFVNIS